MLILFQDDELELLCNDEKQMKKRLGKSANKLKLRLTQLAAASSLSELVTGNLHHLSGDFEGCFALDLQGGLRLVIRPMDDPLPQLPDGSLDKRRVTIVSIEYIGNYHKK